MDKALQVIANFNQQSIHLVRISIFIIMAWIGGLKFYAYEADGIVPFVANSPVMSFFYAHETPEYKSFMNKEGELISKNRKWHQSNHTYLFSNALGSFIILIGLLILAGVFSPKIGALGAVLTIVMSLVTLSFLVTTPESWVPNLGDSEYGFPYLSGRGRLVIKDLIMLAGATVCLSDSAQKILRQKR